MHAINITDDRKPKEIRTFEASIRLSLGFCFEIFCGATADFSFAFSLSSIALGKHAHGKLAELT